MLTRSLLIAGAVGLALLVSAPAARAQEEADWPMFHHDHHGTRTNLAERTLRPDNVANLVVKWSFPTAGTVSGTPAVVGDVVYAADSTGTVYALTRKGVLLWKNTVTSSVTDSLLVTGDRLIFGDNSTGNIFGLDKHTGNVMWQIHPNPSPLAGIWGSAAQVGPFVAIGVAGNDEAPGVTPITRGSVVLLHPDTGVVIWQTFTINEADYDRGATGAGVWCTPTYDAESNTIYITTGNNYTQPTTKTSDAFMALDAKTGKILWVNQRVPNDEWTPKFPFSKKHPDSDIGDSPQIYHLADGTKVVGAGSKNGFYFALHAETGHLIHQIQAEPAGLLGGLYVDSAVHDGVVFANGINWPTLGTAHPQPPVSGGLFAIAGDGSKILWSFTTPHSPNLCGVAVANGVVYFQSLFNGNLYALDAKTGNLLATVASGGSTSGPSVSRGQIYLGTGNPLNGDTRGSIVAIGLPD
jgi:polyvinyl alcohol dehydrogenase (cytochrome)